MKPSKIFFHPAFAPLLIQALIAYEWAEAGIEKLRSGTFGTTLPNTLTYFASKNPHTWFVQAFIQPAIGNASLFADLVQWGELLVGVGLLIGILVVIFNRLNLPGWFAATVSIVSLVVAAFFNLDFYFAAGWTGPSTSGMNILMFWIEVILGIYWITTLVKDQKTSSKK